MSNAVEIARTLKLRQKQALETLAKAERPLRNKDFHERFETNGRRTSGWAKALGPCTKTRNHHPESLWARELVTVLDNLYYQITPAGREVAAVIEEAMAVRPTVIRELSAVVGGRATVPSGKLPATQPHRQSGQLREFRLELRKLLPSSGSWPFLCRGSPLACRVFIVGSSRAREIERPFWSFWSDSRGLSKAEFVRELEKLDKGLTLTRKRVEIIADVVGQQLTLDTNAYSKTARTEAKLKKSKRYKNTDVVEYLLRTVKPEVVLAHGREAKKLFRRHCRDFVDDNVVPREVTWDAWQWQFRLLCSPHLSFRGWTHQAAAEEAERIGQVLAEALH